MTAKEPQQMPKGVTRANRPSPSSAPPNRAYNQPQSFAEMAQYMLSEIKRHTDLHFEQKKVEFDEYVDKVIKEKINEQL